MTNLVELSGSQWTVDVSFVTEGSTTISFAAGQVQDHAQNFNEAATSSAFVFDITPPFETFSAVYGHQNGYQIVTFTVTFSEPVTGVSLSSFRCSDLNTGATGCSVSDFFATSTSVYSEKMTLLSDGSYGMTIGSGVVGDLAGNGNIGAVSASYVFDLTPPTATIAGFPTGATNVANQVVSASFSEPVLAVSASSFSCGSLCSVVSVSTTYSTSQPITSTQVSIQFVAEGSIAFSVVAGGCTDVAGNPIVAQTSTAVVFGITPPFVSSFSNVPSGRTNIAAHTIGVAFSEPVFGLSAAGFACGSSCSVGNLVQISGAQYTVDVTYSAEGSFGFSILSGVAHDAATNLNTASSSSSTVVYDITPPTVVFGGWPQLTNQAVHTIDLTFSEPIVGLVNTAGFLCTSPCAVTNLQSTSTNATAFTVDVTFAR